MAGRACLLTTKVVGYFRKVSPDPEVEDEAMAKMKAAGIEVDTVPDKAPFEAAVKPVWDKYGAKYSELIKRIQAVN